MVNDSGEKEKRSVSLNSTPLIKGAEKQTLWECSKVALGSKRIPAYVLTWRVEVCKQKHEKGLEEAANL